MRIRTLRGVNQASRFAPTASSSPFRVQPQRFDSSDVIIQDYSTWFNGFLIIFGDIYMSRLLINQVLIYID